MNILPIKKSFEDSLELVFTDTIFTGRNSKIKVKDFGKKISGISSFFFEYLNQYNIPLAYKGRLENYHLLFEKYTEYGFHTKIINTVNKRYSKIFKVPEYSHLNIPLIDFFADEDEKVLLSENHFIVFDILNIDEYKQILRLCSKINAVLKSYFERRGLVFSSVNCFFGKTSAGKIVLLGDFSPLSLKIYYKSQIYQDKLESINKSDFSRRTSSSHRKGRVLNREVDYAPQVGRSRMNSTGELKNYSSFLYELTNNN